MTTRNFNTISPSAKSLLFMKGHTEIPFARYAAELAAYPDEFIPDYDKNDISFWARVLHFEKRYSSIDQLLDDIKISNFLELGSGYSFRGLAKALNEECYYIDSDLPEMILSKKDLAESLIKDKPNKGTLEYLALNALDENQFQEIISRFPEGELVILNEGLLMYLNEQEKRKLCNIIHKILEKKGGYWITADIYFKNKYQNLNLKIEEQTKIFFEQHNIEENKFESPEAAEEFFKSMGFTIDREAVEEYPKLSSTKYYLRCLNSNPEFRKNKRKKIQTTWRLKPILK
jgi:O-methyltransferase involved in polyketide biosynthesis